MRRILLAVVLSLFACGAHAAGYTCDSIKQYTSCNSGYYMTYNGSYNGTPRAGNACTACGSGCTCSGGTANRVCCTNTCTSTSNTSSTQSCTYTKGITQGTQTWAGTQKCNGKYTGGNNCTGSCSGCSSWASCSGGSVSKVKCNAGYYKNTSNTCSLCETGYYCPGGTYNASSSIAGRSGCTNSKSANASYYSTGVSSSTCPIRCNANYYGNGSTCTACNVAFTTSQTCTYTTNITGGKLSYTNGTQSRTCYHTTSSAGSTSSTQCTGTANCGSYGSCGSGTLSSVHCNSGYYKNTSNTCTICPTGSYCPGGDFTPSTSNAGITSCSNKPANSGYVGSATSNACPWACNAGYYGSSANGNTSCADCGNGNYCEGGTHRATCQSTVTNGSTSPSSVHVRSISSGNWSDNAHAAGKSDCVCDWYYSDSTRIQYMNERACYLGPGGSNYTRYEWCRTGYYASDPLNFNNWYNSCTACTNKPANSYYTSYSTPSTMYAVENNCPWACNANYYKSGSSCAACSSVSFTDSGSDSGTDTSGCTATSQTVTVSIANGSYKQNQTCSGSRSWTRSKSRTCYRTTSSAGSTAASACTGSANCGNYSYGSYNYGNCSYGAWSNSGNPYGYSCSAGFYWDGSKCATCTAGYACPGFSNVNSPTNGTGRNKCTGTTYSGAGASSCTSCPNSATGYWINGDIHTTINSCWKTVPYTASHGSGVQNCYYTSGSGNSAVYSSSCDTKTIQACSAGYYYNSSSSTTDCVDVGNGYYRASSEAITTRNSCTAKVGAAYTASDSGRDAIGDCYRACTTGDKANSTAISGKFYQSGSNTCAATKCAANTYLNSGSCSGCGESYPYADAGSTSSNNCYKNSTKYGGRNNAALPTGCAAQTQNECTLNSCTYRTYANGTTSSCDVANCNNTHKACTSASKNYYLDTGVAKGCSAYSASYPSSDGGNIGSGSCYGTFSKSGSQVEPSAPAVPSGCASRTYSTAACTPGTCDYVKYASGTIKTDCSPKNCTKTATITSVTADKNYYVSGITCPACPAAYPSSEGGDISDANCFVTKTNTGSQVNGSTPTNCYSVTEWNSCTPGTCNWRDYKSATDTTCTPNNCTKTAKTTTGKSGYYGYTNGTGGACSACSGTYPLSDNGAASASWCYRNQTNTGTRSNAACSVSAHGSCVYNTCTPGTCTWKDYNGATDTTCTPTNCENSVKSWTINAGYYYNGSAATSCVAGGWCPGVTVTSSPTNGTGRTLCSTLGTGYTSAGGTGDTANTKCYLTLTGQVRDGTSGVKLITCPAGQYKAQHNEYYGTSYSCDTCSGATYSDASGAAACTSCPTTSGATSYGCDNHASRAGCWAWFGAKTMSDGSMNRYWCYVDPSANTYGASGNSKCGVYTTDLKCKGGYYSSVISGSADRYEATLTATALADNACTAVGAGYWSANNSLTRTACATGLTTIGYGAGADEANDCGRILHAGDRQVYLRSDKKTTPSLNVKIGDTVYYGNMTPGALDGYLIIKDGDVTYRVHDDSK